MDRIRRDTLLGFVFFGTMAFLLWATVNLTDVSLGKLPPLAVYFEDAGGAPPGTAVLVLGKKIGKSGEATIDYSRPDHRVLIPLLLSEQVPLTTKYRIEIQDAGVLGGKQIYIEPGLGEPLASGTELRGITQKGAFEKIGDVADGKGDLGGELKGTLMAIRLLFESLRDEQNTIGRLTTRRELYDELLQTVQRLNGIFESIQSGQSVFGRLAIDRALGDKVEGIVDQLARTSESLNSVEGTIGLLLNDRATAANVREIVRNLALMVADAKDGRGAVGRLLRDEKMAEDLGAAFANLNLLLQKANDPAAGALGAITSDRELARDLQIAMGNIRLLTEKLNGTDSMLGMLFSDKDLGVRFRRIMTQVSRALEDAREAAPIGNFVQVLLGVF